MLTFTGGDADGIVNGVILDPGLPVLVTNNESLIINDTPLLTTFIVNISYAAHATAVTLNQTLTLRDNDSAFQ